MASSRSTTQIISQILETVYGHDGDDDESITQTKTTYAVHLNNQLNYGIQNFMKKQQDKEDAAQTYVDLFTAATIKMIKLEL
ncbi:MAG: hypothetical protein WBP64_18425 [Nitrososphaeraceae archaeon]